MMAQEANRTDLQRDFIVLMLDAGLDLVHTNVEGFSLLGVVLAHFMKHPERYVLEITESILRHGASTDLAFRHMDADELLAGFQNRQPELLENEDFCTLVQLIVGVYAAGGTWTDYRRQSRKDVLRLRILVLRGRARTRRRATGASDPVVARVLRLPNEMCWHVLKFWRATSAATGEVI